MIKSFKKLRFFPPLHGTFLLENFEDRMMKTDTKKTLSFIFTGIVKPLENIVFLSSSAAVVRKSIPLLFLLLPQSLLFSFFSSSWSSAKVIILSMLAKKSIYGDRIGQNRKKRYKVRKREIVVEWKNSRKVCVCE